MSFIFEDKKLINYFLKLADTEPYMAGVTPAIISGYEAASKLLYKLQSDLGDETAPKASAPVGSQIGLNPEDSNLKVADLRTLGDFLNWVATRKITWNDKRIAWTAEEREAAPNDPEISKAWVFSSYDYDRSRRDLDRQPNTKEAYANKDNLIAYLSYLRDSQEAKEQNVFRFMIGSLIGEVNGFLRIKGESPIASKAEAPAAGGLLDSKLLIDVLPDVIDPENPLAGLNAHPFGGNKDEKNWLQFGDIATPTAFSTWLRSRKIKVKKESGTAIVGALDTDGDPCAAVHVLYQRANYLNGVASGDDKLVANYSKGVAEYLKNVQSYGSTYKGKDGSPCAVTKPGTTAGEKPAAGAQGQPGGTVPAGYQSGGGAGAATGREALSQRTIDLISDLTRKYPLDSAAVSFDKIAAFCTVIQEFGYSPWNQAATQVEDSIRKAKGTLSKSKPSGLIDGISLTTQWTRTPKGDYVIPFTDSFDEPGMFCHYMKHVENVIDNTASLIASFLAKYKDVLTPSEYSIATSQVGSGTSSAGSIYYYNKSAIGNYLRWGSCYF